MYSTTKIYAFLIFCSLLSFTACKKKKSSSDPAPASNTESPYYIKAAVNGTLLTTADGKNGYSISDGTGSGSDGNVGINASYNCSFQDLTSSTENFFQLSLSDVNIADGNDSDELPSHFSVGIDSLNDGEDPFYSLSYTDHNGVTYIPDPSAHKIGIHINEVTDLGTQSITSPLGRSEMKRVVKLKGEILTARLYKYDFGTGFSTTDYVDISNLEFVIRFTSVVDAQ